MNKTDAEVSLLPCPFCGGEEVALYSGHGLGKWVSCRSCGLEAPSETGQTEKRAVEYWNTRAAPARYDAGSRNALADLDRKWRLAVSDLRNISIDEGNKKIEGRCFEILMSNPIYPKSDKGAVSAAARGGVAPDIWAALSRAANNYLDREDAEEFMQEVAEHLK